MAVNGNAGIFVRYSPSSMLHLLWIELLEGPTAGLYEFESLKKKMEIGRQIVSLNWSGCIGHQRVFLFSLSVATKPIFYIPARAYLSGFSAHAVAPGPAVCTVFPSHAVLSTNQRCVCAEQRIGASAFPSSGRTSSSLSRSSFHRRWRRTISRSL